MPQSGVLRVLIADDSAVTRFGIRAALEQGGLEVCGEAADGRAAVELALRERPDVCLLDVVMPEGGGIRAVREISRTLPETAIIMLSASQAGEDVSAAMREGAWGYVLKTANLEALTHAVLAAASGDTPFSKSAVRALMKEERVRFNRARLAGGRGAQLTDSQWEVLELLDREPSPEAVALRLGVDRVTVLRDLDEAVGKLGVVDRHAALELVRRLRSGDPPRE